MTTMGKEEIKKIIEENPNLSKYLEEYNKNIKARMDGPLTFYKKLPFDLKNEKYPNVIYPTKGAIFVHVYRATDMEEPEYHVIEPVLNEKETEKYKELMGLILEKVPYKGEAKDDDALKEIIKEIINDLTIETDTEDSDVPSGGGLFNRLAAKKIRVTSREKSKIEFALMRDIIGGSYVECFMRDPYLEDIHVIHGYDKDERKNRSRSSSCIHTGHERKNRKSSKCRETHR